MLNGQRLDSAIFSPCGDFLQYKTPPPRNLVCWNTLQFRSLGDPDMLNIAMPKSPTTTRLPRVLVNLKDVAAAELALKAHVLTSAPEVQAQITDGEVLMQEILESVNLTEAPEDAVCSLVIDLLQYCEREKINWTQDVMARASEHFRGERTCGSKNQ